MDLGIRGKTAIVCASSRGLGRGCAMALAEAGCNLVVNGRDEEKLAKTAQEIRDRFGVSVIEVVGDVADPAVQKALLAAAPSPDILVNNNGGPPPRPLAELDRKKLIDGVTNNMITPIELVQAVIDGMAERGFGRIVNITSLSVYVPIPGLDLSSGARAGLTSFLAGVARTVISRNVTINNMLPGKLDTDRLRTTHGNGEVETSEAAKERKERLSADIPAKRLGTPEEFGQICAFLCSAHAGYLTGQNIPVDGGLYVSAF
ncbi:3-oxoacyl-[acyl-carrier protein] reductase [Mesorhizobium soli]|uniref:SDR family oxidoreductase n=1 Tax=Pseudaminobacter soli (ex Li et al. 2025) TaxID=1295366 RepID=UPI0024732EAB|nr:SDR family oxidoreductase [Mesorhizobium soli]MDH6232784.1 3-oxoacyl-[acyl-carrier protein] reductase [Mesorhizobium soli]